MNLSKRQFLKMGIGGTAGLIMARFLEPASLLASPAVVPSNYLDSKVHSCWMKLSYNRGQETRETRRILGAALRNLGSIQGQGVGDQFKASFDHAVLAAHQRNRRPGSCLTLVQLLYTDYIYPDLGEAGGHALFGALLSMLRGLDGSPLGESVHHSYEVYRRTALMQKDVYRGTQNPKEILFARKLRTTALQDWQQNLLTQVEFYSQRRGMLNPNFRVSLNMLDGFQIYLAPPDPRLTIVKQGEFVVVSWNGVGRLLSAPTPTGPWSDTGKTSAASFAIRPGTQFYRTVQE